MLDVEVLILAYKRRRFLVPAGDISNPSPVGMEGTSGDGGAVRAYWYISFVKCSLGDGTLSLLAAPCNTLMGGGRKEL